MMQPAHSSCQNKNAVNNKIISLILCNKMLFYLYIIECISRDKIYIVPMQ